MKKKGLAGWLPKWYYIPEIAIKKLVMKPLSVKAKTI